ncbi:hypothetical protein MRX96_028315 [Rhipicephalus microplus]
MDAFHILGATQERTTFVLLWLFWVSVEEMAVGESCLERGRCDGKDNQEDRLAARKGPQGGRRPHAQASSQQRSSQQPATGDVDTDSDFY